MELMKLPVDEKGAPGSFGVLTEVERIINATKAQDEFISNITHDLKAPLSSIYSAIEMVREAADSRLSPEEKKLLDISRRNSVRLLEMIDEILDFSKIESGNMEVRLAPTPVGEMIEDAVDSLRPWAQTRGQTLKAGPGVREWLDSKVQADPRRIVKVLTNLISNAIKATPDGGGITVDVAPREAADGGWEYIFSVADTGCGIAKANHERIFQRYAQVRGSAASRGGAGLGLTIAQSLVELHGGRIWVESKPGQGATFFFTLPAVTLA